MTAPTLIDGVSSGGVYPAAGVTCADAARTEQNSITIAMRSDMHLMASQYRERMGGWLRPRYIRVNSVLLRGRDALQPDLAPASFGELRDFQAEPRERAFDPMPVVVTDVLRDFTIAFERDFPSRDAMDNFIAADSIGAAQRDREHE